MKKQTRGWKRILAVTLAVLIAGSTVEPSALTAAAAGQEPTAVTAAADEPNAATKEAVENDTVSGNSGTAGGKVSGGQHGIATLSGESASAEDVVSLTIGETTTNYTSLSEAVAALPKDSDATLTLLGNCQADAYIIGDGVTGTVTLDLAGHALIVPDDYNIMLSSDNFIVMSSRDVGKLQLQGDVYVKGDKTAIFKENIVVTGTVRARNYKTTVRVEGAGIANLWISDGNWKISSGSVEEIKWLGGELLAITGGTIGKLNCESYLKCSTAFPDGYGVKDPETGNRYTRAELDAEGFSGKMEVSSCTEHVYEEGYCKYCNALIADCKHADLDQTTGVCGNCGVQVLAAVRSEEGNVYCTSWETLCSETEKLVDGKEYTVYFYTDVTATGEQCAKLQNGTVTLDLGGHNIKSGTSGTLFKIAGGAVTIENGTLTGCDKSNVLDVTGGSLRLEKNLKILWENTLYGLNLATSGGETTIDGTSMQSCMYVNDGTVTILDGSFEGVSHESGTLSLKGGSYHMSIHAEPFDGMSVQVGSGTLRDLLSEGYGFRRMEDNGSAGDWILDETALNGNKFAYAVKVEQLPELSITQQPENKTALAGQQETLSVTATSQKELTYQWYLTDAEGGTDTAVDGATAATLTLPGQSGGTSQTYYCVITCDGYPFRSNAATVTWKKIMPVVSAEPKLSGIYGTKAKEFTISGGTVINPEDPAGSALEGTWSITDSNAEEYPVPGTTAEYELTFTPADSAFDSVTVKVTPQVEKRYLRVAVANLERTYGQENPKLELNDVTVDWDQLVPGDTQEEILASLTLETDATAASDVGDYRFKVVSGNEKYRISVNYKDAAGDYAEHGTLTVKRADTVLTGVDSVTKTYGDGSFRLDATANHTESAIQYELTDGEGVVTVAEDGTVTILKAGTAKVRAYLPESQNYNAAEKTITIQVDKKLLSNFKTSKNFYYDRDQNAELDIRAFLPEDCGAVEIERVSNPHEKVVIDKTAYDDKTGILPYRVLTNDVGASATVILTVCIENYWTTDISLTVTWSPELDVYVGEGQKVALKNSVMTYGDSLSTLEFEPVEFVDVDGNTVEGTLAWEDETKVPSYYDKKATWIFTPEDKRYAVLTDFVRITVNQAKPNVDSKPRPVKSNIVYDPAQTLADLSLWGASLSWTIGGKNTKLYGGTWSWVNPTEVPAAGTNSYEVHYEPSDGNYMSFTVMIDVTVAKAKPYIEIAPTAAEITYGDSLGVSGLTGGRAVYGDGKGNASSLTGGDAEVAGTFGWNTPDVNPAVSDSDKTEYEVIFTPTDTDNYETVTTKIKLTVNKAENAPDMPGDTMNVAYKCKKVADVTLDRENWAWQASDLETALNVGVEMIATAVYTGADQGNYENETVTVKIMRSACEHPQTVVRDAKEENCTEKGYTGDTYCTECNEMTASGTEIPAKGHKGGTASCTKKAVCEVCQKEYGEVDATNHPATEIRNVKETSCTEAGYTGDTCCTACNEILTSGTEIPAKGHKGGTASCTKKAVCEVCQKEYGEVDATNHPATEIRNEKEADCTEEGYTGDTCCTACSKVLTSGTVIPAKGHSYTSVITKQPTTAEEGIRTYTCGNCGHSYTEPVAKLSDGDSGSEDTGNTDTGNTDTGNTDSGSADTGNTDTGSEDTGNTDTGNTDTGNTDTGNTDTGSTGTGSQNTGSTDTHNADAEDGSRDARPFLKGENGKEGWDVICEEAKQAPAGEEIPVDMNGTTEVPGSLFDLIRGEDVTLVFDMGNGITWSVNGQDVTAGGVRDIDFGVKYGAQAEGNIPVSVINKVTGEKFYTGLSLSYDGEFGFQAVLSLNMDQKNAGLYASLYYYNEQTGQMEFICEEQIGEDGSVALTFTHASEYILVVDAKTVEQESADTETGNLQPADTGMVATSTQEETHTAWWIFLIGAAAAAGAIAVILVTRKRR